MTSLSQQKSNLSFTSIMVRSNMLFRYFPLQVLPFMDVLDIVECLLNLKKPSDCTSFQTLKSNDIPVQRLYVLYINKMFLVNS